MSDSGGTLKNYAFKIEDESTINISTTIEEEKPPEMTFLNRFFSGPYNRFIHKLRYIIVVVFFSFGVMCIYFGSQISPLTKQEEFLPNDHPMMVLLKDVETNYPAVGNQKDTILVSLNWGIAGLDRSDVGMWDSSEMGKLIWDDEFTVKPVENQRALIDLCNYLKDESELVRNNRVTCWILDMQAMVEKDSTCSNGKLMPFVDESDFNRCLWTFMNSRSGQDYQR